MNGYKSYMDRVTVSDELHEKLLHLEESKAVKRPVRWQRYAVAACAVLLLGVGIWRVDAERWRTLVSTFEPYVNIAQSSGSIDWDIPTGCSRRDLSAEEITALLGGEEAVDLHLGWSAYELTGWAAWYEDGSFWGAYLMGYKGPMDHFEFVVTAGQLPPTCTVFGDSVEQEIWGVTVTADKYDGKAGCERRVSFMKDDYGYCFDLTATGATGDAEKLVRQVVAYVANGEGLSFNTV